MGSPGSARSTEVDSSTGSGTPSTSQRSSWRVKVSWVWSSTLIDACICHSHESCGVKAADLPRPKRWKASTGRSRREPSVAALSSVVAPALTVSTAFTVVSSGSSLQRVAEA